jgi:hypothetical protein
MLSDTAHEVIEGTGCLRSLHELCLTILNDLGSYDILTASHARSLQEQEEKLMITQIELDGFKTFKDFEVELAPFQPID